MLHAWVEASGGVSGNLIPERPMLLRSQPQLTSSVICDAANMYRRSWPEAQDTHPSSSCLLEAGASPNRTYMRVVDMYTYIYADGVAASEGRRVGSASEARAGRAGSDRGWRRSLFPVDVRGVTLPGCFICKYYAK